MFVALVTFVALLLSILLTGALVVLIGDSAERWRDPRRGLPTYRRLRHDAGRALRRVGRPGPGRP